MEAHEPMELGLENALLVAVRAIALWPVLNVGRRADAIALDPFCSEKRHVRRSRAHRRKCRRLVMLGHGGFGDLERLRVYPRLAAVARLTSRGRRPAVEDHLYRRVVDDLLDLR